MPYSLQSVVQSLQDEIYDRAANNFYIEDYYKINGATQLHKLASNRQLLEMILENYWKQNPIYLTSVLVDHNETKLDVFDA